MARISPLRLALLEEDRTQRWLAEQLGRSEAFVSRIVNGLHCDEATRFQIAGLLHRPVHELFPLDVQFDEAA